MVRSDTPFRTAVILSICALAALSLACSLGFAQGSDTVPQLVLEMDTTAEFLDKQERISGGAVVGVAFIGPDDFVNLDDAHVYFSEPVDKPLEMQLSSVDGRYVATFVFKPEIPVSGWAHLKLNLQHADFLTDYKLNEVALLMTNAESGTIYPVRWGAEEGTKVVRVYVNTEGAKSYFVAYDSASERWKTVSCKVASSRSSFKFDRVCDVPHEDVLANNDIEIIRKRGADFGTPLTVNVLLTKSGDP
jgi:hypothetical protein